MRHARFCALLWMVMFLLLGISLLLFSCIHWRNGWSVFIILPCLFAFFIPALCLNYTPLDELDTTHIHWEPTTMVACRELGWTLSLVLLLGAYGIPVLAWYNSGFSVIGAALVHIALTFVIWSYLLWLRVFGPLKNQTAS